MNRPVRVGILSTLETNIGDDFVREGIVSVLRAVLGDEMTTVVVNKHEPWSVYGRTHPITVLRAAARRLPRGGTRLRRWTEGKLPHRGGSRFDDCDLLVQSGAPVVWPRMHRAEWMKPVWHDVMGRLSNGGKPVMNLAAGSTFAVDGDGSELSEEDRADLQAILGYCTLTTARDRLAQKIFGGFGFDVPLIPCSAFLALRAQGIEPPEARDTVFVNYMRGGGHFMWGQAIDPVDWERTAKDLIGRLATRHRVVMLCHNETEVRLAEELVPDVPKVWPRSVREYARVVSRGKAAVCNRLHASVSMAGLGIPSIAIGTDTRMMMLDEIGLPAHFVSETAADRLEEEFERLIRALPAEEQRLREIADTTRNRYVGAVSTALDSRI
jgi:hypothetical protein